MSICNSIFFAPGLLLTTDHVALDPPGAVISEHWMFLPGTPLLDMDRIRSHTLVGIFDSLRRFDGGYTMT